MKLSIAWIFDHIDRDWQKVNIPDLISAFNKTTAEIENWYKIDLAGAGKPVKNQQVKTSNSSFEAIKIKAIKDDHINVFSPSSKKEYKLSHRQDAVLDSWYVIITEPRTRWATLSDFGGTKDTLFAPIHNDGSLEKKSWQNQIEKIDYVIEVDNKSITHRPDLWGHRGFAREIAAILDAKLKPLDEVLASIKVQNKTAHTADKNQPFSIKIDTTDCSRFATYYSPKVAAQASTLWVAARLARLDNKPISAIVDATNYTMLDLAQPMHAFDADKINKELVVRYARNKEKLRVLDGDTLELTSEDIVIADSKRPISLAGIIGGLDTSITQDTKNIILESANFNATTIRRSALAHKKRTEASARFEKGLDPNQNIDAIKRCIFLLKQADIVHGKIHEIISLGKEVQPIDLKVTHNFIETQLGVTVASAFIKKILVKLGFTVDVQKKPELMYHITVPTYRAKDIRIQEDIVEEIARFFGYDNIPLVLPQLPSWPKDLHALKRIQMIRSACAYALRMREVYSYAVYDESWLKELNFDPSDTVKIKNPVSENWQRLVTSLVPHLLKAIEQNPTYDQLRFFEWARVWKQQGTTIEEKKSLAGVFFNRKQLVDFYEIKALVMELFSALHLPVTWEKVTTCAPWYDPHQTGFIMHNGQQVGIAGKANTSFFKKCFEGDAFIIECDGDVLLSYQSPIHRFEQIAKYPAIERDISMLVPLAVTVAEIEKLVTTVDKHIQHVVLMDFFEKKEWHDQKSLTIRIVMQDTKKTMTKEEADTIYARVVAVLHKLGATIR